jgi:hypothetical protein
VFSRGSFPGEQRAPKGSPMNEQDTEAADDWMREHLPDPDEFSLEDNEEEGDTQKYFFLRYCDSATVVYLVAVNDGKVRSVKQEVYYAEGKQEGPGEERWIVKPRRKGGHRRRR